MRLDKYIYEKFNLKSRTYAENLIKTSRVEHNLKIQLKPSTEVLDGDSVVILSDDNFASQGAFKLEEGLSHFRVSIEGKTCADIGCSNGGFCDVLLRNNAKSILAIDVSECQLEKSILSSQKVTFLRENAKSLPETLEKVDFVCTDVSFISLNYILGSIFNLLKSGGEGILLIKPQFELNKNALSKKGIVKTEKDRLRAVEAVKANILIHGFEIVGLTQVKIRHINKNIEYLVYLKKPI